MWRDEVVWRVKRVCVGRDRYIGVEAGVCYGGRVGCLVWRNRVWVLGERYGETVKGQVGRVWAVCWNEKCSVGTCV